MIRVSQDQTLRAECRHSHLVADQYDCNLNWSFDGAVGIKGLAQEHHSCGNECGISASFNFGKQIYPVYPVQSGDLNLATRVSTLTPALL